MRPVQPSVVATQRHVMLSLVVKVHDLILSAESAELAFGVNQPSILPDGTTGIFVARSITDSRVRVSPTRLTADIIKCELLSLQMGRRQRAGGGGNLKGSCMRICRAGWHDSRTSRRGTGVSAESPARLS